MCLPGTSAGKKSHFQIALQQIKAFGFCSSLFYSSFFTLLFVYCYWLRISVARFQAGRAWLRRPVVGLSSRRPGLNSRPVHVRVAVNNTALGQVYLSALQFSPPISIPPLLHTDPFVTNAVYAQHVASPS